MANPRRLASDDPEFQRRLSEAYDASSGLAGSTTPAPLPPLTPIPDVAGAEAELLESKYDQWVRSEGRGQEAGSRAAKFMEPFEAPPPQRAPELGNSWWDYLVNQPVEAAKQVAHAMVPQVAEKDLRPLSQDELAEYERPASYVEKQFGVEPGADTVEGRFHRPEITESTVGARALSAAKGLTGFSAAEGLAGSAKDFYELLTSPTMTGAAQYNRPQPNQKAEGLPVENGTMYYIRLIGSSAESTVIEAGGRIPVRVDSLFPQPNDVNDDGWTTLSEVLLGVDTAHGQKVRYDNPVADLIQGIGERLEEGRGLESDMQAGFRERFGPEWANAGYYFGMGASVLTDWEAPGMTGLRAVAKVADGMQAVKGLAPHTSALDRLAIAVREPTIRTGDLAGEEFARALEEGRATIDDAPHDLRAAAEIASRQMDERSLEEVARGSGTGIPSDPMTMVPEAVVGANVRRTLAEDAARMNQQGADEARAWKQAELRRVRDEGLKRVEGVVADTDAKTQGIADDLAADEAKFAADQQAVVQKLAADHKASIEELVAAEEVKHQKLAAAAEKKAAELQAAREKEVGKLADEPWMRLHQEGLAKLQADVVAADKRAVDATATRLARAQEARVAAKAKADAGAAKLRTAVEGDLAAIAAIEKKLAAKKLAKKTRTALEGELETATTQLGKRQEALQREAARVAPRVATAERLYTEEVAKAQDALKTARESLTTRATARKKAMDARVLKATADHKARVATADADYQKRVAAHQKRVDTAREKLAEAAGKRRKKLDDDFVTNRDEVLRDAKKAAAKRRAALDRRKAELPAAVDAVRASQAEALASLREGQDRLVAKINKTASPSEVRQIRVVDDDTEYFEELTRVHQRRALKANTPEPDPEDIGGAAIVPEDEARRLAAKAAGKTVVDQRKFNWYRMERGDGYEVIKESSKQTPDQPFYRLWSQDGTEIRGGTLEEVALLMVKRRQAGDEIRWKDIRAVAEWDEAVPGVPTVKRNFLFSSDLEETVLKGIPPAEGALRRLDPNPAAKAAGRFLFDLTTRARSKGKYVPKTRLGQIFVEGGRIWARQKTSVVDHAMLPTMAIVPKVDRAPIMREADRALGISKPRWDALFKGAKPTPDEDAMLRSTAMRLGVPYGGEVTPAFHRLIRNATIEQVGGEIAKVRTGIKGLKRWHDRLLETLALFSTDRKRFAGIAGKLQSYDLAKWAVAFFFEDRLAALAPADRARLLRLRTALERSGHEVVATIRAIAQRNRGLFSRATNLAGELRLLLPGFSPVSKADAHLVDEVLKLTAASTMDDVDDAIEQVRAAGQWANWYDGPDPRTRRFGLERWAFDRQTQMAEIAKGYLRLLVELSGRELRSSTELLELDKLKPDTLREVYDEVFIDGEPLGQKTMELLYGTLIDKLSAQALDETVVLATYLVRLRQQAAVRQYLDELVDTGLAVRANDPRLMGQYEKKPNVLMAVALGNHRMGGEVRYSSGAIAWAEHTLERMGVVPGHGAQLVEFTVPGTGVRVIIPRYLEGEIARAMSAGDIQPDMLGKVGHAGGFAPGGMEAKPGMLSRKGSAKVAKFLLYEPLRLSKQLMTFGMGWVIHPGYFTAQFLAAWPTQVTTRGLEATARTAPSIVAGIPSGVANVGLRAASDLTGKPMVLRGGPAVGELLMRMHTPEGAPRFAPVDQNQALVWTDAGEAYRMDELADILRAEGLSDTIVSVEANRALEDSLFLETLGRLNPVRLWGQWNESIRELASVTDEAARIGVFLDEVRHGTPPAAAAKIAKEALMDFRNLAPGEASVLRLIVTFYAYMRKDLDVTLRALIENPGRLAQQARLAHASFTSHHTSELDRGRTRKGEVGRPTLGVDRTDDGRDNRYQGTLVRSSGMGVAESVEHLELVNPAMWMATGTPESAELRDLLAPYPWGLGMNLLGVDYRINDDRSNVVAPWLMNGPTFDVVNDAFMSVAGTVAGARLPHLDWRERYGIWPMAIEQIDPARDVLLADWDATQTNNGVPSVWVIGASPHFSVDEKRAARAEWQRIMLWLGRGYGPEGSIQQQLRAVGQQPNRPGVTDGEEAIDGLFGVRRTGLPTDHEAEVRALGGKRGAMDNERGAIPTQ
jgi:hypothetical protein